LIANKKENMKKIITLKGHFISNVNLVGAVLFGVFLLNACSKSDGPDEKIQQQQLVISTSSTDVMVGDEVTFSVTADGKAIDADIYIDNAKISGAKYTFDDVGTYQAIAKKANYEDSKPVTVIVKKPLQKVAKLTFNKVNAAPYTPAYGIGPSRITMSTTHVYTFSSATEKFKRYSLADDKWEELNHDGQLDFAGIGGKMLYVEDGIAGKGTLFYLSNKMHAYFPKEFGAPQYNNTWREAVVSDQYRSGERAGAVNGKYIYYVGNERRDEYAKSIDRYHPNADKWETPAQMPEIINEAQATVYNNKMYILGMAKSASGVKSRAFYVFDTGQLTVEPLPLPLFLEKNSMAGSSRRQSLIAFNNYILFYDYYSHNNLYVFDIAANQWLENEIDFMRGGVFDDGRYINLMSPSSDKLYAAGTKGDDFILYELDFSVVEE
jgi:hypothetical protein